MTDRLSPQKRSWNMSRIRAENTRPELVVRSLLHRMGYRFRLHVRTLPGSPDVVLPRLEAIIFVHGCFWHRHSGCPFAYTPKSREDFWKAKFSDNIRRDRRHIRNLMKSGWRVLVIWECEIRNPIRLQRVLKAFLAPK